MRWRGAFRSTNQWSDFARAVLLMTRRPSSAIANGTQHNAAVVTLLVFTQPGIAARDESW
jgi:hypothetical protein